MNDQNGKNIKHIDLTGLNLDQVLIEMKKFLASVFSGVPYQPTPSPAPSASPSVERKIPSEWDAAFNGSIPPVTPIAIPSPNDPKTPPDWHLTDAPPAPVAATPVATPAPAMRVVSVEIPADIPDPDWECNVAISSEEYAIIDAYREKKHANHAKIDEIRAREEAINGDVVSLMEVAIELYKGCYIPYTEGRQRMFLPKKQQFQLFCEMMGHRYLAFHSLPQHEKSAAFEVVGEVIRRVLFECEPVKNANKTWYAWGAP